MIFTIPRSLSAVGLALAVLLPAHGAIAAGIDGKRNLVCANVHVNACLHGRDCMQGGVESFGLPAFLFIDVKKKLVRGTDESGIDEVSPISNLETTDKQYILQGIENHRGWTIAINRNDGSMSLTSSGQDVSFQVAGSCTAI